MHDSEHQPVSLVWFESICQELSRNPMLATQAIEQFRESPIAVQSTLSFLTESSDGACLSPLGQFQALSVLQYSVLARWVSLQPDEQRTIRSHLMNLINVYLERAAASATSSYLSMASHSTSVAPTTDAPAFVENKLVQVCVTVWKRSWLDSASAAEKNELFQHISFLLQAIPQGSGVQVQPIEVEEVVGVKRARLGAQLLLGLLDEFSSRSHAEVLNMQFEFHLRVKTTFQGYLGSPASVASAQGRSMTDDASSGSDLMKVFNLALQAYSALCSRLQLQVQSVADESSMVLLVYVPLMVEMFKLLSALLCWDFTRGSGGSTGTGGGRGSAGGAAASGAEDAGGSQRPLKIPTAWGPLLMQSSFVSSLFSLFTRLRGLQIELVPPQSAAHLQGSWQQQGEGSTGAVSECCLEMRNLLLCLPCLGGDVFNAAPIGAAGMVAAAGSADATAQVSRATFIDMLLSCAVQVAQPVIQRHPEAPGPRTTANMPGAAMHAGPLTPAAADYEEGGARAEDLELFLELILRLLGCHGLQRLASLPHFEATMTTLGSATGELSKELSVLAAQHMHLFEQWTVQQQQQHNHQGTPGQGSVVSFSPPADTALLDTWRADKLVLCLDAWGIVMCDPDVLGSVTSSSTASSSTANPCPSSSSSPSFSSYSSSSSSSSSITTGVGAVALPEQVRVWLRNVASEVFAQLLQCALDVYVYEALVGAGEDEDDLEALIAERGATDFLAGICSVGRYGVEENLRLLSEVLHRSLAELQGVLGILGHQHQQMHAASTELMVLKCLEKCRISFDFLSFLLIDNFREGAESSDGVSNIASEAPVINWCILDYLSEGPAGVSQLAAVVSNVVGFLQWQTRLMTEQRQTGSSSHPLVSPLLLQTVFEFLCAFSQRYVDPDPSNYAADVWNAVPQLQLLHGKGRTEREKISGWLEERAFQFVVSEFNMMKNVCYVT